MNIKHIHHVAILTDNYELSKRFYTEILGFTIIEETYREARQSYKLDLAVNGTYQIELFSFTPSTRKGHLSRKQKACATWLLQWMM